MRQRAAIDSVRDGPSWRDLERAARLCRAEGIESVAAAIEAVLRGAEPAETFATARLARSRRRERDRLIGLLYLETYAPGCKSMRAAAIALARDWRDYAARLAPRDLRLGKVPALAPSSRRRFFEIAGLGCEPLCARSIRNVLEADAFALLQVFHADGEGLGLASGEGNAPDDRAAQFPEAS